MRIQSPSLSELHAFAQAARLGSYTLAAEQLSVTQGAISRAIARLEEHLGFALFERQGRRSVLSTAGRQYLDAIGPAEVEQIQRLHILLVMFNAMQPGVFALSGWDLVGALPLEAEQV